MPSPREYHDGTKHHFHRYARSLGYLDWASQPNPFRSYAGAPSFRLRASSAARLTPATGRANAVDAATLADALRHALGLSAWKEYQGSRWSLRVNPSSGNLHPTEAYIVCGPLDGIASTPSVFHYAADRHEAELRCAFDHDAWAGCCGPGDDIALVALTSIHWRESWKYGERAFRYCQHDLGHAIAAVAFAAALHGWRTVLMPEWSCDAIAAVTGTDREEDFFEAEREEPGCVLAVVASAVPAAIWHADRRLIEAVRGGAWTGRANQLSEDHVEWTFIDEIARATRQPAAATAHHLSTGAGAPPPARTDADPSPRIYMSSARDGRRRSPDVGAALAAPPAPYSRAIILQRRSALAFDGTSSCSAETLFAMLARVVPSGGIPFDTLWWTPRLHLALFVHRVDGVSPGLYVLARRTDAVELLRSACRREFLWEPAHPGLPLFLLARGDCRALARRISCDQDIAADGFFSLGMLAEFDGALAEHGPPFYRHLFWESGVIGQVLYLEAEAAGARATGIGCFFDDAVHDVLGIQGHVLQSLYHFTVGIPVDDRRLQTTRGYAWEIEPTHL